MDMTEIVRQGYDTNRYNDHFRADTELSSLEQRFLRDFASSLPGGGRVLDLGCGSGLPYDRYLADEGLAILGMDFAIAQLARGRSLVPQAQFVLADATQIDLQTNALDGIICLYMLFHLPREWHERILQRLHAWLKPGGRLLITLGARNMVCEQEQNWCGAPMAWSSYAPETYREILARVGLDIERDALEGSPREEEYHYWVLASKPAPTSQP